MIDLQMLLTFVQVARARSMKRAAEHLFVSPGAISQRVKKLEEQAGQRLFRRTGSGVELTAAGEVLFTQLDAAFTTIETAQRAITGRFSEQHLVISTVASFAAGWLVPRLQGFTQLNAGVDLTIETDSRLIDLHAEPVHLAIRHGLGNYAGLKSVWLMAPRMFVVASPGLVAGGGKLDCPADCANYPLLHGKERDDWRLWFEAQGVRVRGAVSGLAFGDDYLVVQAAIAGQGLALVRDTYMAQALKSGQLVVALNKPWPTEFAYYLVGHKVTFERPIVRAFCDWLIDEAKGE